MKQLLIGVLSMLCIVAFSTSAFAAPDNAQKADNNPHTVAFYPTGIHAIPTNPVTYVTGTDLVTTRGNTGQIEAWYTDENGHGVHSVWNVSKDGTCPNNFVLIKQAYPVWGGYLTPGADYCVQNNTF